ncbi:MAG: SGNH/GDSL hydrolase family protein [Nocardioides sp.]
MKKNRLTAVLTGLLALVALALVQAPAQAAAPSPSYVALGDSYASGTGTRSYIADGTSCQRSTFAYPKLIAAARGYALTFKACSGATTAGVTNTQLSALTAATSYVSISVGGNDAGFAKVLTECAQPGWLSNCNAAIDKARTFITNTLPGRLSTLYASIRSKAPDAKVVVVGYPRIFNGEDCNAGTWFSPAEESRLNATADLLNSTTSAQATSKGFAFANPASRFVGHAVCDSTEWLNGLSNPISESYHPNKAGHANGYTPVVSPLLTGAP